MENDVFYMKQALAEANEAYRQGEVPIGAVIVCSDRIIAKSHNLTELLHDVTAHAEMLAFTAAAEALGGKCLTGCTLYVTLEPCVMCAGAAGWTQVERIVYGAAAPKRGFERLGRGMLHPKTEVVAGVLADECLALVKDFFKQKR